MPNGVVELLVVERTGAPRISVHTGSLQTHTGPPTNGRVRSGGNKCLSKVGVRYKRRAVVRIGVIDK